MNLKAALPTGPADGSHLAPSPKVAVVIPCWQQGDLLPEAVESVLGQSIPDWEIVIVNDGSTDDTGRVARGLIERHPQARLRLIEQGNQGAAAARNAGIRASTAPYILPLDADDLLKPQALEAMLACIEREPGIDVVYPDYEELSGGERRPKRSLPQERFQAVGPLTEAISACALFRRSLWERVGGYEVRMRAFEDWDFWVKAYTAGARFYHLPQVLFTYRLHPSVQGGLYRGSRKSTYWFARMVVGHKAAYPVEIVGLAEAFLTGVVPVQPVYLYAREVLRAAGSYPVSLVNLSQAALNGLPSWPEEIFAWVEQGGQARTAGQLSSCLEHLEQAVQLLPDDPYLLAACAETLFDLGRVEAARRQFVKAAALYPRSLAAHLGLGRVLLALGDLAGAEAAAGKALALSPGDLEALRLLGGVYSAAGRYADSMQAYLTVLRQLPEDVPALAGLAACCSASGDEELAGKLYDKILHIEPDHLSSLVQGWRGRDSREIRCEQIMKDSLIHQMAADFEKHFRMGNYSEAVNCAEKLMKSRYSPVVELVFGLAGACFRSGDFELALRVCQCLLDSFPNHLPTQELLNKLVCRDSTYRTTENPVVPAVQLCAYRRFAQFVMGKKVIEVGCGLGVGSRIMVDVGATVVATDLELTALKYAQKCHPGALGYVQCSATHLPFAPGVFDFATCVDVIEHIPNYSIALNEMKRVTRKAVLVSTPNRLPENTNPDGTPRNYWHQFEWTEGEIREAFAPLFPLVDINFLCGRWDNPYFSSTRPLDKVQALMAIGWNSETGTSRKPEERLQSLKRQRKLHLIYAGNPLNDESRRAPETIANHLFRYLEHYFPAIQYTDWTSRKLPNVQREDVVLGHPHYDQRTVIQRIFREIDCQAKFLIFPFHHGLPDINLPFDPLVQVSNRLFSITGEYWFNTLNRSVFAHWKEKMVRVDMAVDVSHFPFLKQHFNPPGQRVLFYLGHDAPEKGISHLADLIRQTGLRLIYAGGIEKSRELFYGLDVTFLGPIELNLERLRWIAQTCDFFVNTSVSDANPTTILEMAAIGLPVLCTPESGYIRTDLVYPLVLNNMRHNIAVLNSLQGASETGLLERALSARKIVETEYTWEKFCQTVYEGMEPYL